MKICKNCRYIRKSDNSLVHIKEFSQGKYVVYYVLPNSELPNKVHHCSYVDFPGLFNECEPIDHGHNREDVMKTTIKLNDHELQCGKNRQHWAENLILQLPDTHQGRNSWLLNHGIGEESVSKRLKKGIKFDENTQSAEILGEPNES